MTLAYLFGCRTALNRVLMGSGLTRHSCGFNQTSMLINVDDLTIQISLLYWIAALMKGASVSDALIRTVK
ncbi:MAG: hypothetical protein ACI9T9_001326 [Oleiphilaceae bacterium]|jgi:hypothetical protein